MCEVLGIDRNSDKTTLNRPLFSIIVPVYQCEGTLDRCIQSVLNQKEQNYELLLIDDGSTDRSGSICDNYALAHPNEVRVFHKKNEGPFLARIDGMLNAKGVFLMFLDADDRYEEGILQKIRVKLEETNADMVIFNHVRVSSDGTSVLYNAQYEDGKVFENQDLKYLYTDAVMGENLNSLWQKCVKSSIIPDVEKWRMHGNLVMGEDKLISLSLLNEAKKVVYIAEGLYQYYISPASLSRSLSLEHYLSMCVVYRETLKYAVAWTVDNCVTKLNKDKALFGLKCLSYLAKHKSVKKSEFYLLAKKMIGDADLWNEYDNYKRKISCKARIALYLLRMERIEFVYFLFGIH